MMAALVTGEMNIRILDSTGPLTRQATKKRAPAHSNGSVITDGLQHTIRVPIRS
jgi:hypothetical protein